MRLIYVYTTSDTVQTAHEKFFYSINLHNQGQKKKEIIKITVG